MRFFFKELTFLRNVCFFLRGVFICLVLFGVLSICRSYGFLFYLRGFKVGGGGYGE